MKLNLSKKTILIISGVSTGVILLSLGVGLGVGLSSNSSSSKKEIVTETIYRIASNEFSKLDLEKGSVEVEGVNYNVVKEDGKFYLQIPSQNDLNLTYPTVTIPRMIKTSSKLYDDTTKEKWGKGKDGIYQVDYLKIGGIKIINGVIYGGFEELKDNQNTIIGYRLHNSLNSDTYPNGYEIGSFDENGGGINMYKL